MIKRTNEIEVNSKFKFAGLVALGVYEFILDFLE